MTDAGYGRVLVGEKVAIMPDHAHDAFAFKVHGGYQARCKCGVYGRFHDGVSEKNRKAANADATAHNGGY